MEVPLILGSLMPEHPAIDYFGVWQRYRKVIDANYRLLEVVDMVNVLETWEARG